MKKRIFAAALLLLCLAATALAGGAEQVQYFDKGNRVEPKALDVYTYGGSQRDWLYQMAVSDDGLIALTGWTESSDGTLKNRTKKGRSGWLLVLDRNGQEVVNFCTRLGNHDHLEWPVFHEDGTLTMMLFAEDANVGWTKHELIRIDMKGEVLSRKVIAQKGEKDEHFITVMGHDARGYILQEVLYGDGGYCHYTLYDDEGNRVRRLEEWTGLNAFSDAHVIREGEPDGREMWLYARDEKENESPLCSVFALREDRLRPVMLDGFVSLPDGGAAGAGWLLQEEGNDKKRIGLFTRWDAQGGIVSQMLTPGWGYGEMAMRPGGFAATAYPWDEDWKNDAVWALHLLDQNGVLQETIALTSDAVGTGHNACVGALGDGTVVAAHVSPENGQDAVVTIIRP